MKIIAICNFSVVERLLVSALVSSSVVVLLLVLSVFVVTRNEVEKFPIVKRLDTVVSYSSLEISSILTVSPFFTYPVLQVMTSLIYNTHLEAVASEYIPAVSPLISSSLDVYVQSNFA